MAEDEKNKGGRPATGREYPHKVFGYFDDEGLQKLKALSRIYGSQANAIRQAVDRLAALEHAGPDGGRDLMIGNPPYASPPKK